MINEIAICLERRRYHHAVKISRAEARRLRNSPLLLPLTSMAEFHIQKDPSIRLFIFLQENNPNSGFLLG